MESLQKAEKKLIKIISGMEDANDPEFDADKAIAEL